MKKTKIDADKIVASYKRETSGRHNWEDLWQECGDFCLPENSSITLIRTPGERRDSNRYIDYGIRSNETLAGGLFSYLTPPNQVWQKINHPSDEIANRPEVQEYFSAVNELIRNQFTSSNFILEIHELYMSLGVFGTACLFTDWVDDSIFFKNFHIKDIFIKQNSKGLIDTVYRRINYTARQAEQEFGIDNLSPEMKKILEDGKEPDKTYEFVHACFPRTDRQFGKIDIENKPFASYYIECETKFVVKEGGYNTFPYQVVRFMKDADEKYGRSPAMQCLATMNTANVMKKDILLAGELIVNPQWLCPDNGTVGNISSKGGSIIYYNASQPNGKPERLQPNGELGIGQELLREEIDVIKMAFYNDLFNMLADKQNMTATEVLERVNEKLILFNPIVGRLQEELLKPSVHRIYDVMSFNGKLPPLPEILRENNDFEVSFTGKISLAIEQLEVLALGETINFLIPMAQIFPNMFDNFNSDNIARGISLRNNVPTNWLNQVDEVQKLREARALREQQQQALDQGTQMADAASKLQKKTEAGSPLEMMEQIA